VKDLDKEEMENFQNFLGACDAKTIRIFLASILVWLFGNLVFIPIAGALNWQTRVSCTSVIFIAFTYLLSKALPGLKELIDTFSVFPARKYSSAKGSSYEDSLVFFKHISYITCIVIIYLLYFPFLNNFHPSVSGIILILVLIWIFLLVRKILTTSSQRILGWLCT